MMVRLSPSGVGAIRVTRELRYTTDKLMINQTFHYKIEANSNEVNHLRISLLEAEVCAQY